MIGALSGVIGLVFTGDAAIAALVQPALIVLAVAQPVCGVVFVLDGVLIGAGDAKYLAIAGVLNLVPFVPALVLVAVLQPTGAAGLAWLAVAFFGVYMLARLATLGWRVRGARLDDRRGLSREPPSRGITTASAPLLARMACTRRRRKERPVSGSGTFAFTVHPRARLREDLARAWRPLGLVPEAVYDAALRRLPLPPVTMAGVQIGGERVGHVVLVPFGARHLLSDVEGGRRRVSRRSTAPSRSGRTSSASARSRRRSPPAAPRCASAPTSR